MNMRISAGVTALAALMTMIPAVTCGASFETSLTIEIDGNRYRIAVEDFGFGTTRLPGGSRDDPAQGTRSLVVRKAADNLTDILEQAMKRGAILSARFTMRGNDGRITEWRLQGVRIRRLSFDGRGNEVALTFSRIEPTAAP